MSEKFLIYFQVAGLNDTLCQINRCLKYCKQYTRKLIIDTENGLMKEPIQKYINFDDSIVVKCCDINLWLKDHSDNTIYPQFLSKVICEPDKWTDMCLKLNANNNGNIELDRDYSEQIIVVAKWGGGDGIELLKNCSMQISIIEEFNNRYNKIPKPYIGVHIRNTDKKSNVQEFLNKYGEYLKDKQVFLATDNYELINTFKSLFNNNLHSFSKIPKIYSRGIHYHNNLQNKEQNNIDMFVDLLLLAASNEFLWSNVLNHYQSGYTLLALDIHKNRSVLDKLLCKKEFS